MRTNLRIALGAALISIYASLSAAQVECPNPLPQNATPQQLIDCVIELQGQLASPIVQEHTHPPAMPTGAIVMTDRECAALGSGWSIYSPAGGRVAIAAGGTTDARGERRQFVVGHEDTIGEFMHQLTVSEMPSHSHRGDVGVPGYRAGMLNEPAYHNGQFASIGATGGNQPHNIMQPYVVLNFCQFQ